MKDNTELKRFIQKKLKAGYPAGELKNDLLGKGHTDEEIEALFLDISLKGTGINEPKAKQTNKMHILSLTGASFLITGIAIMSTQTWLKPYSTFLIVLGAVCLCAGYFISGRDKPST